MTRAGAWSAMAGITDSRKAAARPSATTMTTRTAIPRLRCQRISRRTAGSRLTARNRAPEPRSARRERYRQPPPQPPPPGRRDLRSNPGGTAPPGARRHPRPDSGCRAAGSSIATPCDSLPRAMRHRSGRRAPYRGSSRHHISFRTRVSSHGNMRSHNDAPARGRWQIAQAINARPKADSGNRDNITSEVTPACPQTASDPQAQLGAACLIRAMVVALPRPHGPAGRKADDGCRRPLDLRVFGWRCGHVVVRSGKCGG